MGKTDLIVREAPVRGTYFEDVVVDKVQVTPAITVTETHVGSCTSASRASCRLRPGGVPDVLPLCLVSAGLARTEPPLRARVRQARLATS